MALFLIERNLVDEMELDADLLAAIEDYNGGANLRWLFSFLSADRKKSYCLYEAPDAESLRRQAADLGYPADVIVEVGEVNPAMFINGASVSGFLAAN
jgi:hypothetical protein